MNKRRAPESRDFSTRLSRFVTALLELAGWRNTRAEPSGIDDQSVADLIALCRSDGWSATKAALASMDLRGQSRADALKALAVAARDHGDPVLALRLAEEAEQANPSPDRRKWFAVFSFDLGYLSLAATRASSLPPEADLRPFEAYKLRQAAGLSRLLREPPEIPSRARLAYAPIPYTAFFILGGCAVFEQHGEALRTHYLLKALERSKWRITPCLRPGYPRDRAQFKDRTITDVIDYEGVHYLTLGGAHIVRMPPDEYIASAAQAIDALARTKRPAAIVASGQPIAVALPALIAARRLGLPFVYDCRALPWTTDQPSTEREELDKLLGTLILENADGVISSTRSLSSKLRDLGIAPETVHVIEECSPPALGSKADRSILRRYGLDPDQPILCYAGQLVLHEGLEELVVAAKRLIEEGVPLQLAIAGTGPLTKLLKALAADLGITSRVHVLDQLSPGDSQAIVATTDISVVPRRASDRNGTAPSQKLLEALSLAPRIVASDLPSFRELATGKREDVHFFTPGDAASLTNALRYALSTLDREAARARIASPPAPSEWDVRRWTNALTSAAARAEIRSETRRKLKAGEEVVLEAPVREGDVLILRVQAIAAEANPKGIVASITYDEESGNTVPPPYPKTSASERFPAYVYVPTHQAASAHQSFHELPVPAGAAKVKVCLLPWRSGGEITLDVAQLFRLDETTIDFLLNADIPHPVWLEPAIRLAHARGHLNLHAYLLRLLSLVNGGAGTINRLTAVTSELSELEPDWYPKLPIRSPLARQVNGKITICHLQKTAYPFENTGGAIRSLNMLRSQKALGLDPYLITPPGYPRSAGIETAPEHELVEGIEHYRTGANTDGVQALPYQARTTLGAVCAAAIVRRRGASLIHAASGLRGYELALQGLALRDVFHVPMIYEVRSLHEHTWTTLSEHALSSERTELRIRKENRCMELADHVVTISESMRQILVERGVPENKIDVVPNAIDEARYSGPLPVPAEIPALSGADVVVGYISNMSQREGHQWLLRAVAKLRSQRLDVRCLLVGDGPERPRLERLSVDLGIRPYTVFTGEVDHRAIGSYYMAIDIFVVPRVPDYAADWVTPLKPFEAMAYNRPLVVTDLPALREVVGDGARGVIARPCDEESLAQAIFVLASNRDQAAALADRARGWVLTNRTWSANARRYAEIYEHVLRKFYHTEKADINRPGLSLLQSAPTTSTSMGSVSSISATTLPTLQQ